MIDPFHYRARPADVSFGRGAAAENLAAWVQDHDLRRILVVASPSQSITVQRLTAAVHDRVVGTFTAIVEHVPAPTAEAAVRAAEDARADLVLSIGGGSTTGTAKAIALRTGLPVVAIPTTLAGSEMTDTWGMTTDGRKHTGKDASVLPRAVIYDPELLASLPTRLAVTSAFNAMAHCVEAFWGPGANPLSSILAADGIRRLADGLRALKNEEPYAHELLQYGSFLAGLVFAEAGSGLHHKICHALGGAFDLSHAGTHTVILPSVLRFNAPAAPEAASAIAEALGSTDAADGLDALVIEMGAPRSLRDVGLGQGDLQAAVDVVAEKLPIENPRVVTRADLQRILTGTVDRKDDLK